MLPPAAAAPAIDEPPVRSAGWSAGAALASKAAAWFSQGLAEASLPTLRGLYWGGAVASAGLPAPWKAKPPPN